MNDAHKEEDKKVSRHWFFVNIQKRTNKKTAEK